MNQLQHRTVDWLIHDKVGLSSRTMAAWLGFGEKFEKGTNYPHDPDDLDRCLAYLHAVPEARALIPKMAELNPVWAALVEHWDDIERQHLDEIGLGWSKSHCGAKTYALLRHVIGSARSKA